MLMITTAGHNPWPLDIPISNLELAGLPAASFIRMKFFTLDHRLILKKLGVLHKTDQVSVTKTLRRLFGV